jgi:preprotein translocase subunit SecE
MTILEKIRDYFKGSFREMKKVVWPTKKQTITYTSIVIGMSIGVAVFFGILDYAFNIVLAWII